MGRILTLLHQPANAIRHALRRDGTVSVADLDLIEINEASAGVALASTRDLGAYAKRVTPSRPALIRPNAMPSTQISMHCQETARPYATRERIVREPRPKGHR